MRIVSIQEANERIKEICNSNRVPFTEYSSSEFPDGRQNTEDHISINRSIRTNWEFDGMVYLVEYRPWLRSMLSMDLEEFDAFIEQCNNVRNCINELNDYLRSVTIKAKEN